MLPSKEAAAMKRGQEQVQQENINALLDRKNEIEAMKIQNEIDLNHLGWNRPMTPIETRKLYREWHDELMSDGFRILNGVDYKELTSLRGKLATAERKLKILRSKLFAKQRKDAGPAPVKKNINVPAAFRKVRKSKKK